MYPNEDIGLPYVVDDKLITMTNKILNMRKKLDSVNKRFSYIRHELSDQHEYVVKLAKIKEVLEEQESVLKKEVVEIAKKVLHQRCAPSPRSCSNITQNVQNEDQVDRENLHKYQKENYNRMVKLRNEIDNMKKYEEFQKKRLNELQRIKGIIFRLVAVDDPED